MCDYDASKNIVNIARSDIMNGALRAFGKKNFNEHTSLDVKFVGEACIDDGSPSREFLSLITKEIRDSPLFHGLDSEKFLQAHAKG